MFRKNITLLTLFAIIIIALISCKPKNNDYSGGVENLNYDYPLSVLSDTIIADVNDASEMYPIREEVLRDFLQKAKTFVGKTWTANISFPENWFVKKVERLNEGKEIWLVSSENKDFNYLVVTSGYGTQRILDVLPVAMSITNQVNDDLETETWQTLRLPDGQFRTTKEYEWIHSMANATKQDFLKDPEKFHRKTKFTEQFFINDQWRFEMSQDIDTLPDYKAVIFYFKPDEKPTFWDDNIPQLQAFCEENGVLFEEVSQNFNRVTVRDFELTFALETDITQYIGDMPCGMVMMSKGEDPKTVHFGSLEYMKMEIRRYFKLRSDFES